MTHYLIKIEYGRIHNENKNPVAEKTVREVKIELLHHYPEKKPIT